MHVSRELTTQPNISIFVNICNRLGKLINRVAHLDGAFGLSRIYARDEKVCIRLIVRRSCATWSAWSFAAFVFGLAAGDICGLRPLLKRLLARFEAALEGIALHAAGNRLYRLANLSPWELLGLARIEVRHGKVRVHRLELGAIEVGRWSLCLLDVGVGGACSGEELGRWAVIFVVGSAANRRRQACANAVRVFLVDLARPALLIAWLLSGLLTRLWKRTRSSHRFKLLGLIAQQ